MVRMVTNDKKIKVLIADDAPEILARLTDVVLEVDGVELVGAAGDGDEAWRLIEALKPDSVILDLQMPGLNGLELLKLIRGLLPATLVIILTAYDSLQFRERCEEYGANYFLSKHSEFDRIPEILQARINKIL